MRRIHAVRHPGETHVALLRDGRLDEFYIHRPGAPDGFGDVHMARVVAVAPAMAGAFLALEAGEGFLPDTEGAARPGLGRLGVGDHVVVRVTRAAQGGKGPRLSARLDGGLARLADGAGAEIGGAETGKVRLLQRGPSPLDELRAAYRDAAVTHNALPDDVADEVDGLGRADFDLPGGLRGCATATAALTAIDLDSGGATAARADKASAQFAANRDAIPELARQIRLRNFSGAVLIDFAGMPAKRRAALAEPLRAALAQDRLGPRLAGFSTLGFAEILRPRRRPPLHDMLRGPHAAGLAALRRVAAEAASSPARRLALRASPGVVAALQADAAALAGLAHVSVHALVLHSDPSLAANAWIIEDRSA